MKKRRDFQVPSLSQKWRERTQGGVAGHPGGPIQAPSSQLGSANHRKGRWRKQERKAPKKKEKHQSSRCLGKKEIIRGRKF